MHFALKSGKAFVESTMEKFMKLFREARKQRLQLHSVELLEARRPLAFDAAVCMWLGSGHNQSLGTCSI